MALGSHNEGFSLFFPFSLPRPSLSDLLDPLVHITSECQLECQRKKRNPICQTSILHRTSLSSYAYSTFFVQKREILLLIHGIHLSYPSACSKIARLMNLGMKLAYDEVKGTPGNKREEQREENISWPKGHMLHPSGSTEPSHTSCVHFPSLISLLDVHLVPHFPASLDGHPFGCMRVEERRMEREKERENEREHIQTDLASTTRTFSLDDSLNWKLLNQNYTCTTSSFPLYNTIHSSTILTIKIILWLLLASNHLIQMFKSLYDMFQMISWAKFFACTVVNGRVDGGLNLPRQLSCMGEALFGECGRGRRPLSRLNPHGKIINA